MEKNTLLICRGDLLEKEDRGDKANWGKDVS